MNNIKKFFYGCYGDIINKPCCFGVLCCVLQEKEKFFLCFLNKF